MSKTSWEDIDRLTKFCKAYRERRPNSPIVRGVKIPDGDPIHLDISDLETLVEQAKDQLPLRDRMRLHETVLWTFDEGQRRVVRVDQSSPTERRIMAAL
ncbi:hypothetical protein [Kribbella italica]|uniref:Uncharacterized protein n=1 Tax=Kribbella italica TaxID=1540520 RepID=A0A7W9J230_9ACTN|nr:hypothetical protein [Kribbella italica]MBB5833458.1 hypothetical protein [Kribbella italica]